MMRRAAKTEIHPERKWLQVEWHEFWSYRYLLWVMVLREWETRYKQTFLGVAWYLFYPLLATLVFTVIFGFGIGIPTNEIPPLLFYLFAMVPWTFFSQSFTGVSSCLVQNQHVFRKVYFPRIFVPLAIVLSNLMTLLVQAVIFLLFYFYYKYGTPSGALFQAGAGLWGLPGMFLLTGALALGAGLWIAALSMRYRDLQHMTSFIAQLWMYLTPVIYPVSALSGVWKKIAYGNPLTAVMEGGRQAFFGTASFDAGVFLPASIVTLVILISGFLVFNRLAPACSDEL